jgi:SAM-dependent methyltransferase
MADRLPRATFVGIDNSQVQIEAGRQAIAELGLKNIQLRQQDIAQLDDSLGQFDYVICHGVYSWISPDLQEKLLAAVKAHLAPRGVAYISYNTYPGWHQRDVLRELAAGRTPADRPASERIARARELFQFFSQVLVADPSPAGQLLKKEIDLVLPQGDSYVFHEYLESDNRPLYFHEFAERTSSHGLQYLGEAAPMLMFAANFGQVVEDQLMSVGSDVISIEQHMDLLRNRAFRQTLLCHDDVTLTRFLSAASLEGLRLCGRTHPESVACDVRSNEVERFVTAGNSVIATPSPVVKTALFQLGSLWPASIGFGELVERVAQYLSTPSRPFEVSALERRNLGDNLVQCIAMGLIQLHSDEDAFVTHISEFPRASTLASVQSLKSETVINRRHKPVKLDQVTQNLLPYLDGKHDRAALLQELSTAVSEGRLSILVNGLPATRGEAVTDILRKSLDDSLLLLASNALLIG